MKKSHFLLKLLAVCLAIGAAFCLISAYADRLEKLFDCCKKKLRPAEYDDYADLDEEYADYADEEE